MKCLCTIRGDPEEDFSGIVSWRVQKVVAWPEMWHMLGPVDNENQGATS